MLKNIEILVVRGDHWIYTEELKCYLGYGLLGVCKLILKVVEAVLGNSIYGNMYVTSSCCRFPFFFSQMHWRCSYCTGSIVNSCLFFIFLTSMQSILPSSPLWALFVVTCHIQIRFALSDLTS